MKIRKILAITLVLIAIFATLNVASAGLFDFLGGDSSSNDGPIGGEIKDSNVKYEMTTKIGIDKSGEIYYADMLDWDGDLEIELTNASDDQLSAIKEAIQNDTESINVTLNYDTDLVENPDIPYESTFTLEDKILKVKFSGDCDCESNEDSGSFKVESGNITIPGETPIEILF
jgi:hypothetical protein